MVVFFFTIIHTRWPSSCGLYCVEELTHACVLRAAELRAERMGMESYTLCDFQEQLESDDGDLNVGRVTHGIQHWTFNI